MALLLSSCGDNDFPTAGQNSSNFTTPIGFTCNPATGGFFCPTPTDWGLANGILKNLIELITLIPKLIGGLAVGILTWLLQAAQSVRFNYSDNRVCTATSTGYLSLEPLTRCADQFYDALRIAPVLLWIIPLAVLLFKVPFSAIFPGLENEGFGAFFVKLFGVTIATQYLDGLCTIIIDVPFRVFLWILGIGQSFPAGSDATNTIATNLNALNNLFVVNPNNFNNDLSYITIVSIIDTLTAIPLNFIGLYFLIRALMLIILFIFSPLALTSTLMPETAFFFSQWRDRLIMTALSILPVGVILRFAILIETNLNAGNFNSSPFQFFLMELTMLVLFGVGAAFCFLMLMNEARHVTRSIAMGRRAFGGIIRQAGVFGGVRPIVGAARGVANVAGGVFRSATAERFKLNTGEGSDEVTFKRQPISQLKNATIGLRKEEAQRVRQIDAERRDISRVTRNPIRATSNLEYQERNARSNAMLSSSMQSVAANLDQLFKQQQTNANRTATAAPSRGFSYSTDFYPTNPLVTVAASNNGFITDDAYMGVAQTLQNASATPLATAAARRRNSQKAATANTAPNNNNGGNVTTTTTANGNGAVGLSDVRTANLRGRNNSSFYNGGAGRSNRAEMPSKIAPAPQSVQPAASVPPSIVVAPTQRLDGNSSSGSTPSYIPNDAPNATNNTPAPVRTRTVAQPASTGEQNSNIAPAPTQVTNIPVANNIGVVSNASNSGQAVVTDSPTSKVQASSTAFQYPGSLKKPRNGGRDNRGNTRTYNNSKKETTSNAGNESSSSSLNAAPNVTYAWPEPTRPARTYIKATPALNVNSATAGYHPAAATSSNFLIYQPEAGGWVNSAEMMPTTQPRKAYQPIISSTTQVATSTTDNASAEQAAPKAKRKATATTVVEEQEQSR